MTLPKNDSNTPLAGRVLKRIAGEHLVPRPRWEFLLKNYFFWALGALAVILGALAFSATLFEIANVDWRLSPATHTDFFSFFLAAAPFLWVFALAFFILVGYINVRRTEYGYRYPLAIIAFGAVLTSISLGSGLYAIGFGAQLDESIGDHPPFYRPILVQERSWWQAPEKGLLGGEVVQAAPNAVSFAIRDFSGHLWQVDGSDLLKQDLSVVARGGVVRVVGVPLQEGVPISATTTFHACFIFPWDEGGPRREQLPPPLTTIASTSGRSVPFAHSKACKGIRPYEQLRGIQSEGL